MWVGGEASGVFELKENFNKKTNHEKILGTALAKNMPCFEYMLNILKYILHKSIAKSKAKKRILQKITIKLLVLKFHTSKSAC